MNILQLRQSLKQKWLSYYEQNSSWLVKMRVWASYDGLRRPSSGFILATLSVLEPEFEKMLSFMMDLSNNPDKIIAALGLNFNPDEELHLIKSQTQVKSHSSQDKLSQESKVVPLVLTATKVIPDSFAKTGHSDLLARIHKPENLVAVITKISPNTSVKLLHSIKPDSGLLKEEKPVRSAFDRFTSGGTLTITSEVNTKVKTMPSIALATEISNNSKPMRSLAITTQISHNGKPERSLAITTEINSNGKDVKSKANVFPSTNARSVASWVDEFCQGTRCDRQEDIFL
jgi:Family of unknown function (DUF5331)